MMSFYVYASDSMRAGHLCTDPVAIEQYKYETALKSSGLRSSVRIEQVCGSRVLLRRVAMCNFDYLLRTCRVPRNLRLHHEHYLLVRTLTTWAQLYEDIPWRDLAVSLENACNRRRSRHDRELLECGDFTFPQPDTVEDEEGDDIAEILSSCGVVEE